MRKRIFIGLPAALFCILTLVPIAHAQNTDGKWMIGFNGGGNMWLADFNQMKVGAGGDVTLRYGVSRFFSLGIVGGFQNLKTSNKTVLPGYPTNYLTLKAFPASLNAYVHLLPRRSFAPYLYIGGGAMMYQRGVGGGKYLPDNKFLTTYLVPAGLGFQAFVSKSVSFSVDAGYSNIGDWVDRRKNNSPDGFLTAKAGINFYLGSSDGDDDDEDGLTNAQERRLGTDPNNPDTDGDGLKDGEEVKRYRTNPLKQDTDGDGLADGEELMKYHTDPLKWDTDGDGLSDGDEINKYHTDPLKLDTDGDGLSDGDEVLKYHSDPLKVDTDGDGLSDYDEVMVYHTDPNNRDTDGDGLTDGDEVKTHHTNPLKADTDGGGVNDGEEVRRGTNPLNPKDDFVTGTVILEKGKTVVLEGINFATGSARLAPGSEQTLDKAFSALVANPGVSVEIAGYTDNVGNPRTNQSLSLKRAEAVKAWLVAKGISAARMTVVGKGSADPIAPNTTTEGRAKNRRIEFHVK